MRTHLRQFCNSEDGKSQCDHLSARNLYRVSQEEPEKMWTMQEGLQNPKYPEPSRTYCGLLQPRSSEFAQVHEDNPIPTAAALTLYIPKRKCI